MFSIFSCFSLFFFKEVERRNNNNILQNIYVNPFKDGVFGKFCVMFCHLFNFDEIKFTKAKLICSVEI